MYSKVLKWLMTVFIAAAPMCRGETQQDENTLLPKLGPACAAQLKQFCTNAQLGDDVALLQCLYALDRRTLAEKVNQDCLDSIDSNVFVAIDNKNLKSTLQDYCRDELLKFNCQVKGAPGSYLKCIVSNLDNITDANCAGAIKYYRNVAFLDPRWTVLFLQDCRDDMERMRCGDLNHNNLSAQSLAISCLEDKLDQLAEKCRAQILLFVEIVPSNFKFDRQLFTACHIEYVRYCRYIPFDSSDAVFACLGEHVRNGSCYNELVRRKKLISRDYKISKGLMRACKDDIKRYRCRKQTSDDKNIRLSQILLCIESAIRDNEARVDSDCRIELVEHRKMLMQDYRLIPEIVDGCSIEIETFCSKLDFGSKTIHCLMEHARSKHKSDRVRETCQRSLELLMRQVDIAEDWRVDSVLHEACHPVVRNLCRGIKGGNARVMSCLLDNIGADEMLEKCENALMQIQYFVARDFKLDPQLYRECQDDAVRLCHASANWLESNTLYGPDNSPLVLPCLFRYIDIDDSGRQLRNTCIKQIRRIMQQRAISVDLQPEIEKVCLDDLALLCFDKTAKGEEIQCLQKNLDDLQQKCQDAVSTFTEEEAQFVDLNPFIRKYCKRSINTYCNDDQKGVLDCLIAHKNYPDVKANNKCRASIEHFQIISLKDYHFTYKFKTACKSYVMRYCRTSKSKASVVGCLSEKIRNDTINGLKSDIHKDCKQQVKAQLFQQRENIDFDPSLNRSCFDDLRLYCPTVEHGTSQALECLQSTSAKLSMECRRQLFKIKTDEMADNSVDYALVTACSNSVRQFCPQVETSRILECLKRFRNEANFDKKCRTIVMHRLLEQQTDFRLNPLLRDNCKRDIDKFCKNVVVRPDVDTNGQMIKCLTTPFKRSKLSDGCEVQMAALLKDKASSLPLNPTLVAKCKRELETICKTEDIEEDVGGQAENCLKEALVDRKISSYDCRVEVADLIDEAQADIHVDPQLERACAFDLLKFCGNVNQGHGRYIKCLKIIMADESRHLERECQLMLTRRLEMYNSAAKVNFPQDLHGLYSQVITSPSKHYFFMVLMITLGSFFVIGIFCGRVSKRYMLLKNK